MNRENHSLGQKVFQRIRGDILKGNYKRGEELKEKAICEEMGVSRTPVREALRQLELEGLVNIISNKGAYVVGFTPKDIKDIYEIRTVLESLCARWAAIRAEEEQIEVLEEIIYLTDFHVRKGNMDQVMKLGGKFHEILYEAGGSRILEQALQNYHHYLERVRTINLLSYQRAVESNEEHRRILEAIKEQDAKKAEDAITLHLANSVRDIDSYEWENITGGEKHEQN